MLQGIRRKLAGRGPAELLELARKNVAHAVRQRSGAAAAAREADGAFDRRWGTDTSGRVMLSGLDVDAARARHGVHYQASSGEALSRAVLALGVDPAAHGFVDYGSGKGRIVMMAAEIGFARVEGVEFSPELCRIAEANVRRFMAAGGAKRAPRIVHADAGAHRPAAGPLFAYLYNPFGPPVIDEVMDRLEEHAAGGDPVAI
ncbi:MAG TPA: hypothetical protein VF636_06350, partial [Sphingomonas sp.]